MKTMTLGSKMLLATGLIAAVVAVGFWLARLVVQEATPETTSAPEIDTESAPVHTGATPAKSDPLRHVTNRSTRRVQPTTGPGPAETAPVGTNFITDWENRMDDVLGSNLEPSAAGKKLIEMLPQLPADGRVEVLQHAANLVSNEDYAPMGKLLVDPETPEEEVEILMRDMLNRPNSLKLPLLLQVARATGHLKSGEAKEILEVFLGESYGEDWDKWQSKVNKYLKENPEVSATNDPPSATQAR